MQAILNYIKHKWLYILIVVMLIVGNVWICSAFNFREILSKPTLADWIQVAVVLVNLGMFWKLISRDKQRDDQINALEKLAREANAQTKTLDESKRIMQGQLENVQKEYKRSIKPYFGKNEFRDITGSELKLGFTNYGQVARYKGVAPVIKSLAVNSDSNVHKDIRYGHSIVVHLSAPQGRDVISFPYEFKLKFTDEDNNRYSQLVKGTGHQYEIEMPVEDIEG